MLKEVLGSSKQNKSDICWWTGMKTDLKQQEIKKLNW